MDALDGCISFFIITISMEKKHLYLTQKTKRNIIKQFSLVKQECLFWSNKSKISCMISLPKITMPKISSYFFSKIMSPKCWHRFFFFTFPKSREIVVIRQGLS